MMYEQSELVQMAKRDNNPLRPYLLVNPLLGKHIPVKPGKALTLFRSLSQKLYEKYAGSRLLVIGFAETATAIASAIAAAYPEECFYIQTTREQYPNASYLIFSEEHSHASEQKLILDAGVDGISFKEAVDASDYILFAEDEVTTGRTIKNCIRSLDAAFAPLQIRYGVVSILNSMSEDCMQEFAGMDIQCTYLLKYNGIHDLEFINRYTYPSELRHPLFCKKQDTNYPASSIPMPVNPRFITTNRTYEKACLSLSGCFLNRIGRLEASPKILVLGTEEFMYPALKAAENLEKTRDTLDVLFHATTRSPILPSMDQGYPLYVRYELRSPYDKERITYLYNLQNYDKAFLLHDSHGENDIGVHTICSALNAQDIHDITIFHAKS